MNVKLSVDRIGKGIAVCLIRPDEKHEVHWPVSFLPDGVREGDILNFNIDVDVTETEAAKKRVGSLLDQLKQRSGEK